jgi:trans-2,3-dihydro-3-hydroxyanthranilate isomerase
MLFVPVRTLEALSRCRVNASILHEAGSRIGITEWYVFTRETMEGGTHRAHARLFAPDIGIAEDPATGGAAGPLGAYLIQHGAIDIQPVDGAFQFVIEQGDFIQRPSRIEVEIQGERGNVGLVRVGGPSVVVAHAELIL